jgi:Zn-dependent peptidase ImmA (M78 family)
MYSDSKIISIAACLKRKYKTDNPFDIAENMDVVIVKQPLGNVWGLYKYVRRSKVIFINTELEYVQQKFACGHELGHAILHPRENCSFLKAYTLLSASRLEQEASIFAAYLLWPSEDNDFFTYEQLLTVLKVTESPAIYEAAFGKAIF